jgi:hypothetical protein
MYLALRRPWGRPAITAAPGAPPVVVVPADAGPARPKKKRPARPVAGRAGAAQGDAEGEADEPLPVLTAGDRALEWRGDDVALPPRSIDAASEAASRGLDDAEIGSTIDSQAAAVRDCVVTGATNTDLRATITVKLLVDGQGRVTRSRVQAPRYLFEHGLLGCAQRAVGRMKFPAVGGATVVTLPIHLG